MPERLVASPRCPRCRRGFLLQRQFRRTGERYWICDRYPEGCSFWSDDPAADGSALPARS